MTIEDKKQPLKKLRPSTYQLLIDNQKGSCDKQYATFFNGSRLKKQNKTNKSEESDCYDCFKFLKNR